MLKKLRTVVNYVRLFIEILILLFYLFYFLQSGSGIKRMLNVSSKKWDESKYTVVLLSFDFHKKKKRLNYLHL